jgi:hypothetical protein
MPVKARAGGQGRVRGPRVGGQTGSGSSPGSPTGDPGNTAFQANFLALSSLPAEVSFARASNAMVTDSTGTLTYAPNNLLTYSSDLTNAAWTLSNATIAGGVADPLGGNNAFTLTATGASGYIRQVPGPGGGNALSQVWLRRRTGTGTTQFFLPNSAGNGVTLTSSWQQFVVTAVASGFEWFQIQCDTSGDAIDIFQPQTQLVTYETTARPYTPTTSAAYYGPRFDHNPAGRTNLLLQSNNFSDAAWDKSNVNITTGIADPLGGTSAFTVTATAATAQIGQGPVFSGTATNSVWIRRRTGTADVTLTTPGASHPVISVTGSWQRFSNSGTDAGGNAYLYIGLNASGDAIDVYSAQTEPGSVATSYIPTTTAAVTVYDATGLLIEEQRTNLVKDSGNQTTANWGATRVTRSISSTLGADNSNFMTLLTSNAAGSSKEIQTALAITITSGANYAVAFDVKKTNWNYVRLGLESNSNTHWISVIFDLSTGTITETATGTGSGTIVSSKVTLLTNGIYRVEFVGSIAAVTGYPAIGFAAAATGNSFGVAFGDVTTSAAGTETLLVDAAQFELGSHASSYIPTTSAAVTRSADIAQLTGAALAQVLNTTSGTSILVEVADLPSSTPSHEAIIASSGSRLAMFRNAGDNYLASFDFGAVGGVVSAGTPGVPTWANSNRGGCSYSSGGFSLVIDGGPVGTGTAPTWGTDTAIGLGYAPGGSNQPNGHIRSLAIYSSRLSDADLQAKSVVGASF